MHIQIAHKISKYVYIAWLITMFITFFVANKGNLVKADTSELTLVVSWSTVNIEVPETIDFWSQSGSSMPATISKTLSGEAETFYLDDQKGSDQGYYTTIQISDFVWLAYSWVIPASNAKISISSGTMLTYAGVDNPDVFVNTQSNTMLDSALTFIERDSWSNFLRIGKYYPDPNNITIDLEVPSYQAIDSYAATLTVTLYDDMNP